MFYAPVLFQTMGFATDGSLLSAVVTGGVNVVATVVSIVLTDRVGRRKLLLEACAQMLVAQMAVGGIMLAKVKADTSPTARAPGGRWPSWCPSACTWRASPGHGARWSG